MNTRQRLLTLTLALAAVFSTSSAWAAAGDAPAPQYVRVDANTPPEWLAHARAAYPLDTCVVSNDELGMMGEPVEFIYRQEGQPDRLLRFCCKDCVADFKKDPAKYLNLLDAAAAKKSASESGKS